MVAGDCTANNFAFRNVSRTGASAIQGYFMTGGVLFVDRPGKRVLLLNWQGTQVLMEPPDTLSLFSGHLFDNDPIIQTAYSSSPVMRLWFLRASGSVVCCEYDDKYNVRAWWTLVTDGTIESITVGLSPTEDSLFMSVVRNGHHIIEHEGLRDWPIANYSGAGGLQPPVFLDSAVQKYNATPFTTITAGDAPLLANLNGKTVACWGDGAYLGTAVVSAGAVTLPMPTGITSVHYAVVGLPFTSIMTSMPMELGTDSDSTQAKTMTIPRVSISFYISLDAQLIGVQGGNAEQATLGGVQLAFPTLFTGIERMPMPSGYARGSCVTIQSSKPLPLVITAIVPEVAVYE